MSRRKELGDIVAIELPNSKKAYGRVYKEYTIGIYNGFYDSVDALTGRGSLYHHGEIYPCTYEECKELEVCAAWHINHVIDMLMGDDKWDKSIRKPRKE